LEPNTPWKYDIEICVQKNVHGLTFDQVSKIAKPYVDRMIKLANKQNVVVNPYEELKIENQSLETTGSVLPGSSGGGTDAHTAKPSTHSKFDIQNLVAGQYEELQKESILLKEVIKSIQAGKKVMVVLRGIPGSGKSHLANRLKGQGIVVSHDRYLTDLHGKYILNEESVVFAISMARKEVLAATKSGRQLIIIDGHNLEDFEISHYLHLAKA
jgi:ABC-type bacteriocin/lantibiotic exporter with double-glycine peptidase domain